MSIEIVQVLPKCKGPKLKDYNVTYIVDGEVRVCCAALLVRLNPYLKPAIYEAMYEGKLLLEDVL